MIGKLVAEKNIMIEIQVLMQILIRKEMSNIFKFTFGKLVQFCSSSRLSLLFIKSNINDSFVDKKKVNYSVIFNDFRIPSSFSVFNFSHLIKKWQEK